MISPTWYPELLAFNAEQNLTDEAVALDVVDSFRNVTTLSTMAEPTFRDPTFRGPPRPLPPGPMLGRVVLGAATVLLGGAEYDVFRELVQPYNFSYATGSRYTFLSPPWTENMTDAQGYASVTLRTDAGPQAVVEQALFFTESCGRIGWIGTSGFDCRPCPPGGVSFGCLFVGSLVRLFVASVGLFSCRRDWAHRCHICTGTGLTPATSAPGLGHGGGCLAQAGTAPAGRAYGRSLDTSTHPTPTSSPGLSSGEYSSARAT